MSTPRRSAVSAAEVNDYLSSLEMDTGTTRVERVEANFASVRQVFTGAGTRPGGYIPGPQQMTLVDLAVWVAVFTRAGITPMAVTWELKINFLRPAMGADLIADAHLRKFGRFSYADVELYMDGAHDKLVSSASATYFVPDDGLERARS